MGPDILLYNPGKRKNLGQMFIYTVWSQLCKQKKHSFLLHWKGYNKLKMMQFYFEKLWLNPVPRETNLYNLSLKFQTLFRVATISMRELSNFP